MTEEQQFSAVLSFSMRMGIEVSGRSAFDVDLDERLRLLAEGSLREASEQDELLAEISGNAVAISRLADHLNPKEPKSR